MEKRKRKKKNWTTKNTHIKKMIKRDDENRSERIPLIWTIIIVLSIIGMFIAWSLNTDRGGYDHFIGIPQEWIKWLK